MSIKRITVWLLVAVLFIQISACGTILYPERRGQSSDGGLDVTVVLLDGAGLLLGLIPGIIAFAVDFNNGSIYLPANQGNSLASGTNGNSNLKQVSYNNSTNYEVIKVNQDQLTQEGIEQVIYQRTGKQVNLSDNDVKFVKLDDVDQIDAAIGQEF